MISLPVHSLADTSLFVFYYVEATDLRVTATPCQYTNSSPYTVLLRVILLHVILCKAKSRCIDQELYYCISKENQVGFEQILRHLMSLLIFDFSDGKHLIIGTGEGDSFLRYNVNKSQNSSFLRTSTNL